MARKQIVLYGRRSVRERLVICPASIKKVHICEDGCLPEIESLVRKNKIPVEKLSDRKLDAVCGARDHQGIIARTSGFEYVYFEYLLDRHRNDPLTFIFLDGVNDPHNLGVIIRCLACFGKMGLVIPTRGSCGVTDTVIHVAAGGENYVPVSRVQDLAESIGTAKKNGYTILGGVISEGSRDIKTVNIIRPCGLVMGSEGSGINSAVMPLLDEKVRISTPGAPLSLNISQACVIFCYELMFAVQ